jgi:hypothetical protein
MTTTNRTRRHTGPREAARAASVAAAALAACGLTLLTGGVASASTVNGVATITEPGVTTPLTSGGSTTPFTVSLPTTPVAACDGDTATHGYHVYSYLVKEGVAVSSLTFGTLPSAGYGFVGPTGTYYGPINTAIGTGQIIGIPNNFEWAPLVSDDGVTLAELLYSGSGSTASGVWNAGLACANTNGVLTDNWNIQVTFSASSTDPTGFTWTAVAAGSTAPAITSATSATFTEGSAGTFTPTASGNPTPTITESGTLPAGVTFTSGVLSGTPTVTGSFPVTFTASNGIGTPATQSFTLTVQAASTPTTTTTTTTTTPTTTTTTTPGSTTTTTTVAATTTGTDTSSGGGTGDTSGGSGSSTDPSGSTLAYTGFHTVKGLGVGLLGVGVGLMLLGWGYRKKIRPARLARRSTP